jgi:calcineurin-like phosphoesterase family protein
MNKNLIINHNNAVSPCDDVWFLGDICFRSKDPLEIIKKLAGHKHLIVGNHDKKILNDPECIKQFEDIQQLARIRDGNTELVLCHYPMAEWDGFFRGVIHFYGHIHNNTTNATYKIMKDIPNAYNVGADILNYRPRKLNEVIELNKKFFSEHN